MYFLAMNPFFFCCWQQFAIGLLAASASRHGGMGSEEWWRSICFSYLKKNLFYQKIFRGLVGLVGFGVYLSWRELNSPCAF